MGKKDQIITMLGIVKEVKGGGAMVVLLDNGQTIDCHASGKMKRFNVRIILGDRVEVEISPYELTKGRISKRLLENKPTADQQQ